MTPQGGKRTAGPGKRLGRPVSDNPRRNRVEARLTDDELTQLVAVAPSPSDAIRELLQRQQPPAAAQAQEEQP